jgi:NADPH-dependent curcumin reductase CurA
VKESKSNDFKIDDIVTGNLPWRKQMIVSAKGIKKIDATMAPPQLFFGHIGHDGTYCLFWLDAHRKTQGR